MPANKYRPPRHAFRLTIHHAGAADGVPTVCKSVSGGAALLSYVDALAPFPEVVGRGYEQVVLETNVLPPDAAQWLVEAGEGSHGAVRDVVVEVVDDDEALSTITYRGAVIARYAGPRFDAASKDAVQESIAFLFASAEERTGPA